MRTVQEIKAAIDHRPLEERAGLIPELCGWSDDDWNRQMKTDASAGKFVSLNEDADSSQQEGKAKPLSDLLNEP